MRKAISYVLCFMVLISGIVTVSIARAEEPVKFAGGDLLPANAKEGECYAKVFVPPTYRTVTETALKKEASEKLIVKEPTFEFVEERVMTKAPSERWETVPATYEWVEERDPAVLEKIASGTGLGSSSLTSPGSAGLESGSPMRLEVIPATYEWIEEKVLAYPEHTHLEDVPAVYKTVTEKVIDQPAHTVWKKGSGPIQKIDYSTGEIMCLVKVPATYKTITKRVLVTPATTREVVNPAKYTTVKKQVMKTPAIVRKQIIKTPATVRKIEIPAEYKMVKVRKMVSPAQVERVTIPEEFQTVSRKEMITEGRMEWRPILCETNVSPNVIYSLQKALKDAGYNPGNIDGDLGRQTMSAVNAYQKAKGLPSGELTLETLKSLNINF